MVSLPAKIEQTLRAKLERQQGEFEAQSAEERSEAEKRLAQLEEESQSAVQVIICSLFAHYTLAARSLLTHHSPSLLAHNLL